ncbi:MAG: hypothetical protein FWD17_03350 [Polyangiaceae bacterium]|nr:hypothetical protein [Polyangiaceae bacterium]
MDIRSEARIPFARSTVFATLRDDLAKLLPYLSNVRSIEVRSRRDDGPIAEIVNEWHGGGDIPGPLRAVLGEAALSWADHARWDASAFRCAWRTETRALQGAVQSHGENAFHEAGPDATRVEFKGQLEVDAKKIRGVPGFLASTVGRSVEEFLVSKVQANLLETARAVEKYLSRA